MSEDGYDLTKQPPQERPEKRPKRPVPSKEVIDLSHKSPVIYRNHYKQENHNNGED